jgi:ketosteroid isomerase-like protein
MGTKMQAGRTWSLPRAGALVALLAMLTVFTACTANSRDERAAPSPSPTQTTGDGPNAGTPAVDLVRRHLEAANRGKIDAWTAALHPNVRFDIAGAIYEGRAAARDWAARDPIGQRGHYDILSRTATGDGVTADLTFRAGSLVEEIRYQYTLRDGLIVDLVARYRR